MSEETTSLIYSTVRIDTETDQLKAKSRARRSPWVPRGSGVPVPTAPTHINGATVVPGVGIVDAKVLPSHVRVACEGLKVVVRAVVEWRRGLVVVSHEVSADSLCRHHTGAHSQASRDAAHDPAAEPATRWLRGGRLHRRAGSKCLGTIQATLIRVYRLLDRLGGLGWRPAAENEIPRNDHTASQQ